MSWFGFNLIQIKGKPLSAKCRQRPLHCCQIGRRFYNDAQLCNDSKKFLPDWSLQR